MPREHHFYVSIAKHVFYHETHGVVMVRDPIRLGDATNYGLRPIILYGLAVPSTSIRWVTFSHPEQPRAFLDVLFEAWRAAEGLRGMPEVLRYNRHLANACPELAGALDRIDVRVEVSADKSLAASLRTAQDASMWVERFLRTSEQPRDRGVPGLCIAAKKDHAVWCAMGFGSDKIETKAKRKEWLELPTKTPPSELPVDIKWAPGRWLSAWESSLPPSCAPRYFHLNEKGFTWLLTGDGNEEDQAEAGLHADDWSDEVDISSDIAECVKNLMGAWPNPPVEIAKAVGITLRELQWFVSDKVSLESWKSSALMNLLAIDPGLADGYPSCVGPYALIADTPLGTRRCYDEVSHGGDATPFEILPDQGAADPSWRYVLVHSMGDLLAVVLSPRGAKISDDLPRLLLNYAGAASIPAKVYREVVSACARACAKPEANVPEMTLLAKRWFKEDWLPDLDLDE